MLRMEHRQSRTDDRICDMCRRRLLQAACIRHRWTGKRRFWQRRANPAACSSLALHFAKDFVTQNLAAHSPNQNLVVRSKPCSKPHDKPLIQVQSDRNLSASLEERRSDLRIGAVKVKNDERSISVPKLLTVWRTGNLLPVKLRREDSIRIKVSLLRRRRRATHQEKSEYRPSKKSAPSHRTNPHRSRTHPTEPPPAPPQPPRQSRATRGCLPQSPGSNSAAGSSSPFAADTPSVAATPGNVH
jgi:hypothetical protein